MKDLINKAFSLGLGLAASTKDQAEKLAQELSARSQMSKADSQSFVNGLIERGQEARLGIESSVKERMKQTAQDLNLGTRDEIRRLEERIARLEEKLGISADELADTSAVSEAARLSSVSGTSARPDALEDAGGTDIAGEDAPNSGGDGRADGNR